MLINRAEINRLMKKELSDFIKLNKRDFLRLAGTTSLLTILGCGDDKGDDNVPPPPPPVAGNPQPGPQQQIDYHNYTGMVRDTDGNPLNVDVSLSQIDQFRNFTGVQFIDTTDQNGRYELIVTNGDYRLGVTIPPGYFSFFRDLRIVSSSGNLTEDITLIRKVALDPNAFYRNPNTNEPSILEMIRDISGNRLTDTVQRVRRFDIDGKKITYFLDRNNAPSGYLASVLNALRDWEVKSGLSLFEEIGNSRDANIIMSYERIGGKGLTDLLNLDSMNGVSIPARVKVRIKDDLSQAVVKAVAAREVGHSLFGKERYSQDRNHAIFKDPNYLNTGDPLGGMDVTPDEGNAVKLYYNLPIGLELKNYS